MRSVGNGLRLVAPSYLAGKEMAKRKGRRLASSAPKWEGAAAEVWATGEGAGEG